MARRYRRVVVWFRRDLRVQDNTALSEACRDAEEVIPLFVVDDAYLKRDFAGAARIVFMLDALAHLEAALVARGGRLVVRVGTNPAELLSAVAEWDAGAVYFNRVYEPQGKNRDEAVARELTAAGRAYVTFKDLVLQEAGEILTAAGRPHTVFSAYQRHWRDMPVAVPVPAPDRICVPPEIAATPLPTAAGLKISTDQRFECGGEPVAAGLLTAFVNGKLDEYGAMRDLPGKAGTSMLSRHLHFGTISPRTVFAAARSRSGEGAATFLTEICWRDFFVQLLASFPRAAYSSFKPSLAGIQWENDESLFEAWKNGRTGYPIVDAAMRQLNSEAWMHNRCRMIVASFLTKDLLIDWRWGEKYFMNRLVDGDQPANNGGWQWSAGTGADAQPWFRIFNPVTQGEKFDAGGDYVRRYIPELAAAPAKYLHQPWTMPESLQRQIGCVVGRDYPFPIVDHAERRGRALAIYRAAESKAHEE